MGKVAIIGGGGIRTPLLIHGLAQLKAVLGIDEVVLYDLDVERVELIASLSREVATRAGASFKVVASPNLEDAVAGASFVLSSIRVGGIAARARDERIAIEHGIAGQETTGFAGMAMAMRTIPVALEHARVVERHAPGAWLINFTNPAGLITQALTSHTSLRVIGICDTPSELFHRIAAALNEPVEEVRCDYFGLNHLGWVRRVRVRDDDVIDRILADDRALRSLYHADLFDPEMIRALGLIPSEYLFFYYCQRRALENQLTAGASRGEEIAKLNVDLFKSLRAEINGGRSSQAVAIYRDYLNRRSGSYMRLEAQGGSAFEQSNHDEDDPFEAATGYHRIALDVLRALARGPTEEPDRVVVNVPNCGAISDLEADDIVEVPCNIDRHGPRALPVGSLPESVRGLVLSVKAYERLTIRAALEKSTALEKLALTVYPLPGDWNRSSKFVDRK